MMVFKQTPPRGQHWLVDEGVLDSITAAIKPPPGSLIVEIGPGRGALTDRLLAEFSNQVLAIEVDQQLVGQLADRYLAEIANGRLQLELADCRRYDWESLNPGWYLAANIPYYLTAFLLRQLADTPNQPVAAVLLLPQPIVTKLSAGRGSLLAVIVGAQYNIDLLTIVPPQAFEPPPKVTSQLVRLQSRGDQRQAVVVNHWPGLCQFWRQAFSQPRQTLLNNLKSANWPRQQLLVVFDRLGLSHRCRPGDLNQKQWLDLWRQLN